MKNYIVYKHISPSNKVYIGITSKNPIKRWSGGNGYINNDYFMKAINKYGWNKFRHEILFTELSKEEAEQKEIELIAKYKSDEREFGYNIQHGGSSVGKHSEETKIKISISNKGKKPWDFGKHHSKITRKKISKSHFGIIPNEETRIKMSIAKKGKKQSKETIEKRAKACGKKIICCETGEIYSSIKEASEIKNIYITSISNCLRKRTKTAGGYHWEYFNQVL